MQVSTKFFNETQINNFSKISKEVQDIQERIASGKKILRASDDPVAAVNLSAAKEQQNLIERFENNIESGTRRLILSDSALQEATNVMIRIGELAVQAANDTYGVQERQAIVAEVEELVGVMVNLANTRDTQGQSLFAGFKTHEDAFVTEPDGRIIYNGDRGRPQLQVSESMTLSNGIDGGTVFGRVETSGGRKSIFDMLSGVAETIKQASALTKQASAQGVASLDFNVTRDPQSWSFTLEGSEGLVEISANVAEGKYQEVIDAINAQSHVSGIQATLDETGDAVILTDQRNEKIILSDVQIEGIETSADEMTGYVDFSTIDGNGNSIGSPRRLTDRDLLISNVSADIGQAIDHLSVQKSYVGAQLNKASRQADILAQRKMAVSEDVAKLGEADLAALVTEMQALLINRDAAQQAFAKIGQQSLFDFLR